MLARMRIIHLLRHSFPMRTFPPITCHERFQLSSDVKPTALTEEFKPRNTESVIEIYDQLDGRWEEDPEFDYHAIPRARVNYDILSSSDLPPGSFAETMVICSGLSSTHVCKAASAVYHALKYKRRDSNLRLPTVEGLRGSCGWIVIDLGNMILHLFLPEVRAHYRLEELWSGDGDTLIKDEEIVNPTGSNLSKMKTFDWGRIIEEVQSEHIDPSSRK